LGEDAIYPHVPACGTPRQIPAVPGGVSAPLRRGLLAMGVLKKSRLDYFEKPVSEKTHPGHVDQHRSG
jgi:hypothetical protein